MFLVDHLQKVFGISHFRNEQENIIKSTLNGEDCFVIMQTGGGKVFVTNFPQV